MQLLATCALVLLATPRSSSAAPTPAGVWQTVDDRTGLARAEVRIEIVDGRLLGTIERLILRADEGSDPVCTRCTGARAGRRVIGLEILTDFKVGRDGSWDGGRLLDPKSGAIYAGRLWLDAPQRLRVRASSGLFSRTQTWQRRSGKATSVFGLWETRDDDSGQPTSEVELAERDGRVVGTVRRLFLRPDEGDDPVCTRCPGARRGRRVIGLDILRGHRLEGERWVGGTVLDPENGKEYRSSVWIEPDGSLRVRGYVGPFFRTQTWRRRPPTAEQGSDVGAGGS